jgi:hypothetical protein
MKLFHIYLFCTIIGIIGIIVYHNTKNTCTIDNIFTSDNILSDTEYDMVVHETNKLHHLLENESANNTDMIRKK